VRLIASGRGLIPWPLLVNETRAARACDVLEPARSMTRGSATASGIAAQHRIAWRRAAPPSRPRLPDPVDLEHCAFYVTVWAC